MKSISVFEAFPFLIYFDLVQCSVLLVLTLVILLLTVIHFRNNKPPKLMMSRPSSFEYYVLKGEHSEPGDSRYGTGTASGYYSKGPTMGVSATDPYASGTETRSGVGTGAEARTGTETGTEADKSHLSTM